MDNFQKEFEIILKELKAHTPRKDGRKIALSKETFFQLLQLLQGGLDREEALRAIKTGGISKPTFYHYLAKSESFRYAVERAEDFPNTVAQIAVVNDFTGKEAKIERDANGQPVLNKNGKEIILSPAVIPNVQSAMWWLERVKKMKFSKSPDVINNNPLLGAPKDEAEASAMSKLFELANKYVKSESKPKRKHK